MQDQGRIMQTVLKLVGVVVFAVILFFIAAAIYFNHEQDNSHTDGQPAAASVQIIDVGVGMRVKNLAVRPIGSVVMTCDDGRRNPSTFVANFGMPSDSKGLQPGREGLLTVLGQGGIGLQNVADLYNARICRITRVNFSEE